jgi:hypothetical protein
MTAEHALAPSGDRVILIAAAPGLARRQPAAGAAAPLAELGGRLMT